LASMCLVIATTGGGRYVLFEQALSP
jgi:hypothetical protein